LKEDLLKIKGRIIPAYLKPYAKVQINNISKELNQANKRQTKHA